MSTHMYDIVIVGGGTAGLVLANRLSEDPSLSIVVLESGKDMGDDLNMLTPGAWPMLPGTAAACTFSTVAQTNLKKSIKIPQGRALGGSSAINSFLFTPASGALVDGWKDLGNEGWDFSSYRKALERSFTLHKHGGATEVNGPLQVKLSRPQSLWEKAWMDGLKSSGFPEVDPLSGRLGGAIMAPETINPATRQRSYAANAYLYPIHDRPNLTVLTETTVTKLLLERPSSGGDAVARGVQYTRDGASQTIQARKEVIVSAGVINSPRLLELSGIGGADLLKSHGIDVVVDNPHVGENLQNHVFSGVVFEANDDVDTLDAFFRQDPEAIAAAQEDYMTNGTGPMGTSNMITMAHLPLPEMQTNEGRQVVDSLLASAAPNSPEKTTPAFAAAHEKFVRSALTEGSETVGHYVFGAGYTPFESLDPTYRAPGKYVSVVAQLSHPLSRGSVHITEGKVENAGTDQGLSVDTRLLSHPLDLEVLARQVRFAEELVTSADSLTRHLKPHTKRFTDLKTTKEYVCQTAEGAHHYTGTCSMMPRAMGGVVDSRLRLYGCSNLRVCDSSIVPISPSANPQAVVYAVAELGASFIKEDLKTDKAMN